MFCKHNIIIRVEERNTITETYRKARKNYSRVKGSITSGRTGEIKWVCLDCVKRIEQPTNINPAG